MVLGVSAEKLEVLRRLDGQWVTLGIGPRGIVGCTGKLRVGDATHAVTLSNGRSRLVLLGDVRWVVDPATGALVAGPW